MYIIIYMYIHACVPFSEIIMCEVVDHNLTSSGRLEGAQGAYSREPSNSKRSIGGCSL